MPDARTASSLTLTWSCDIKPVLDGKCLVKNLIPAGSLGVIYGESNCGKSFFASDISAAISMGRDWRGRKVERGAVLYIPGEGATGIRNRIAAAQLRGILDGSASLAMVNRAADFLQAAGDVDDLIQLATSTEDDTGDPCRLIIVDTLNRAMAASGGNENAPEDMGRLIGNADLIREKTGAAVWFIHHAGKESSKGARGHSSLRAAVDTEIFVEGQAGVRTATVVKQRDLPIGDVFSFELDVVELGNDQDGESVTSCVLKHTDYEPIRKTSGLGKWQQALLRALEAQAKDSGQSPVWSIEDLRAIVRNLGAGKSSAFDTAKWFASSTLAIPSLGGMRLNYAP
jgi:hypothetical protein